MDPVVAAKVAKMLTEQLKSEEKRTRLLSLVLSIFAVLWFMSSAIIYMIEHPIETLIGSDSTQQQITESNVSIKSFSCIEDTVWYYLKEIGFNDYGAAAVMGNIRVESSFRTNANHNNHYFGHCQWGGGRWYGNAVSLSSYAALKGTDWTDLQTQLSFLEIECRMSYPSVYKQMKNATETQYACDYFCTYYEGCVGQLGNWAYSRVNGKPYQCLGDRRKYAEEYYSHYSSKIGKVN